MEQPHTGTTIAAVKFSGGVVLGVTPRFPLPVMALPLACTSTDPVRPEHPCITLATIAGADSRVSTGTYVSNRASDKITSLSDSIYLLRSGSAADTQVPKCWRSPNSLIDHASSRAAGPWQLLTRLLGICSWWQTMVMTLYNFLRRIPPY